jgi:hypothetical protein
MPEGWRWSVKPPGSTAILEAQEGRRMLVISKGTKAGDQVGGGASAQSPVVFGADLPLESGKGYRLRARLRASVAGPAHGAVHCYVPKRPFWSSPGARRQVGTEWREFEWTFVVPKPGDPNWHEQMHCFNVRFGWEGAEGQLEVADVRLHEAAPQSFWEAWQAQGADAHSVVADPVFEDAQTFEISKQSPVWKLGFERIPFEQIGPRP